MQENRAKLQAAWATDFNVYNAIHYRQVSFYVISLCMISL